MAQGTIKDYFIEERVGSLLLDDRTEVAIDADSTEGSGIRYLRIGQRVNLDEVVTKPSCEPADVLAVDEALDQLARDDAQAAQLVKLRFFSGLTGDEAAAVLGVSPRSADFLWSYARAWIFDRLGG